jgi:hypothetical protein
MIQRSLGAFLLPLLLASATVLSVPPRAGEQAESHESMGETSCYALPYGRGMMEVRRAAPAPPPADEPIVLPRHEAPLPAADRLARAAVHHAGDAAPAAPRYFPAPTAERLPYDATAPPLSV